VTKNCLDLVNTVQHVTHLFIYVFIYLYTECSAQDLVNKLCYEKLVKIFLIVPDSNCYLQ